ncbi:MAG: Bug family tripartite tricarboxylate transporter substrate binding protein [Burkholderiaceae bacterium]
MTHKHPTMGRRHALLAGAGAIAAAALPSAARSQGLSSRPVRLLIAQAPGTTPDSLARLLAPRLQARWNQPFVVENRPGASGALGMDAVAKAPPDGHTMQVNVSTTVTLPLFYAKLGFDPLTSFQPVGLIGATNFVLVVHQSVPVTTVREWITWAKSQPGKLNYASPGLGTHHHLCMELLKQMVGVDIVHVPYKAASQAYTDFIGGQIPTMFMPLPNALGFAKEGRIRLLAGTMRERFGLGPELPSLSEAGVRDFNVEPWYGLWAPAGMGADLLAKYDTLLREVLAEPETREALAKIGVVAKSSSPTDLGKIARAEFELWTRVLQQAGIKPE